MTRLLMNQFNQTSGCRRHAACGAWEISCYAPWSLGGWGAHLGCRNHALMDLLFHQEWWFAQMSNNAGWTVCESNGIMCKLHFVIPYYILLIHIMIIICNNDVMICNDIVIINSGSSGLPDDPLFYYYVIITYYYIIIISFFLVITRFSLLLLGL